ncbi:MAG: GH92 family glycosyl hydrolase, partial [Muribaculaceae bacterium]
MRKIKITLLLAAAFATLGSTPNVQAAGVVDYVDPMIGTGFHGHVFMGASVPFGMVQLGPNNIDKGWDWCSGYHHSDSILIGFSHNHLSGTGCGDLGDVMLMPMTVPNVIRGEQKDISKGYASKYRHETEVTRPDYYSVMLERYGIKAELTATTRVGLHRYTYPAGKPSYVLVNLKDGVGSITIGSMIRRVDDYTIEGYRYTRGWSPMRKTYFVLKANKKIRDIKLYAQDKLIEGVPQLRDKAVKGMLDFGSEKEVMVKVALSSVSCENAHANMAAEMPGFDFDGTAAACRSKWEDRLGRIEVTTNDAAAKRVFYTSLYHTMIAPSVFCDVNGQYRGIDDMIYTAKGFTNYTTLSLWDTYRTLCPLFTIVNPEIVPDLVNTMLSVYKQNDKLPIWALHSGETECMPGYSSVPIIADAYLKGFTGFNANDALNAMVA